MHGTKSTYTLLDSLCKDYTYIDPLIVIFMQIHTDSSVAPIFMVEMLCFAFFIKRVKFNVWIKKRHN